MTGRRALITGGTGQDGVLLAEFLSAKGYQVYSLVAPGSSRRAQLATRAPSATAIEADITDRFAVESALETAAPQEIYNLAAVSSVGDSWRQVEHVMAVNLGGVVTLLTAIQARQGSTAEQIRFYQASSSEMFGLASETPQRESTPFHPRSPYAVSKSAAHFLTINYRESYGMFACSGILYNHESTLRPMRFVTRKVTRGVAAIAAGLADHITLGDLEVARDWGYAPDYVRAMWLMLQADEPDDFVVATGVSHTLRQLLDIAFLAIGIREWDSYVRTDPALIRPAEVSGLVGDATKARALLGWEPRVEFEQVIKEMVEADLAQATG